MLFLQLRVFLPVLVASPRHLPDFPHPSKLLLKKCAAPAGRCEDFTPRPVWSAVGLMLSGRMSR